MFSPDIQILIPCHSFEDFPTEQTDDQAESLLNSFAIAFHPTLLAWTGEFPRWRRADDTPLPHRNQLIIIPTVSDGWLPHSWADDARSGGDGCLWIVQSTRNVELCVEGSPHGI